MKRKKLIMVAGIVCLLLIVVLLPSMLACTAPEIVAVPKVVGLTVAEATSVLEEAGLKVGSTIQAFSASVEEGLVMNSEPAEGVIVQKGSTVTLVVSKGPEMVTVPKGPEIVAVPKVAGLTAAEAMSSLEEAGLKASTEQAFSSSVEAGLVISSDPAEGVIVQKGSTVDLVVSKGPEMVTVPKVMDLTAAEATSVLEEAGLKVGSTTQAFSASVEAGLVMNSEPAEGASVQKGSTVDLVVSKGPEMVEVPWVVGLTAAEATSVLEKAGLKVSTEQALSVSVEEGLVMSSDPAKGASVQKGSTVDLVVSKVPGSGLNYEYFEGTWSKLPDFDILTPVNTGNETNFHIPVDQSKEYFGYRFMGYIEIVTAGDYTFYTISDDGSQLYIGTTLVVDNDGLHATQERSGMIRLSEGLHRIMVTYFERYGSNSLGVQYQGPGINKQPIPDSVLYRNY